MTWVVRTADDPRAATSYARAAIHAVDANLGVSDVATMEQVLADSTSDRRLNMLLFALLGGLALALATVGVYGVVAYSVTQRTHEIGVRMAIGARPADVVRMMLREGGRLAVVGVAVGSVDRARGRAADSRSAVRGQRHRSADVRRRRRRAARRRAPRELHPRPPRHARRSDDRPCGASRESSNSELGNLKNSRLRHTDLPTSNSITFNRDPRPDDQQRRARAARARGSVCARASRIDRVEADVEAEREVRLDEPARAAAVVDRLQPLGIRRVVLLSFRHQRPGRLPEPAAQIAPPVAVCRN